MSKPTWFPFTYFYDVLNSPRVKPLAQRLHPSTVVEILKGVFDDARQELRYAVNSQRLPDVNELLEPMRKSFSSVKTFKPKSSRAESKETFFVGLWHRKDAPKPAEQD